MSRWAAWWSRRGSEDVLLVGANLAARALGFLVSLLLSRQVGVAGLGAYSSILITSASATTPMSVALANHGTLMTTNHAAPERRALRVMRAQAAWWALTAVVGVAACHAMLWPTVHQEQGLLPAWGLWLAATLLAAGQLLTQWMAGVMHGASRSRSVALISSGLMLACALAAYPVIRTWGLAGAMVLAVVSIVGPGVGHLALLLVAASTSAPAPMEDAAALRREAWRRLRQSLPSSSTSLLNTGTNWVCTIYLVHRLQGFEGVGILAIALQWSTLMQLAFSSWGGKILHALSGSQDSEGAAGLQREMREQVRRCVKVALASSIVIVLAGPAIALLYKVDIATLTGLLMINAVAAVLSGANYVYERVFFMLESQRAWLGFSALAYAVQLLVTVLALQWSVLGVALGNAVACAITLVAVRWHLMRTLAFAAGQAGR